MNYRAWAASCLLGATVGMLFEFVHSGWDKGGTYFLAWIQDPYDYWYLCLFGAVIGGLLFYVVRASN
jgi:hypothetical protein